MYISAQVFIAVSSILYGLSSLAKNKKLLFLMQIFSSTFYGLHCFFMHAYVGGIVTIFDLIRVLIFYIIEKRNGTQKQKIVSACVLFVVAIICSAFSWEGWYSLLPLSATLIFIITLGISNLFIIKCAVLISAVNSTLYLFLAGSKFGAMFELIPVVLAVIGIAAAIVKQHKQKRGVN